jgi:hypothetical protein
MTTLRRVFYEDSLALARAIGDRGGMAIVLTNLGFTAYALRDRPAAAAAFDEALRIATEIGATLLALEVLVGLARLRASMVCPSRRPSCWVWRCATRPATSMCACMQIELFIDEIAGLLAPERMTTALERGGGLILEDVVAARIRGEAGS